MATRPKRLKYCPMCSLKLSRKVVLDKIREYCKVCQWTHYLQMANTAGVIVANKRGQILLVQRKRDPYKGQWMLPAGFVEYGENPVDSALREMSEEVGLRGKVGNVLGPYLVEDDPRMLSVMTIVVVKNIRGKLKAGDDANEARFFDTKKLPKIAFVTQAQAIEDFITLKRKR